MAGDFDATSFLQELQRQLQQIQIQQAQVFQQQQLTQQQIVDLSARVSTTQLAPPIPPPPAPVVPNQGKRCSYFMDLRSLYDQMPQGAVTLTTSDFYLNNFGFKGAYTLQGNGKMIDVKLNLVYFNSESTTELKCRICLVDPSGQRPTTVVQEKSGKINSGSYQSVEDWARGCAVELNLKDMKDRGYLATNGRVLIRFDVEIMN